MGDKIPEGESVYAKQGTLSHRVGELSLKKYFGMISPVEYLEGMAEAKKDPLYDKVCERYGEMYAEMVIERFNALKAVDPATQIFIETKIDLSDIIPDSFGFSDATIIGGGVMEQIDYKFGIGVPVSAVENEQQKLYAYGGLSNWDFLYDIQEVRITIYQPRIDDRPDTWITTPDHIRQWCKNVASPAALLAGSGGGIFQPGNHCQFCKARPTCKALADDCMRIARDDFKAAEELTDNEISEILLKESQFSGWIKAVKAYALEAAVNGRKWPGFKLVRGTGKRRYADPQAVIKSLTDEAYYDINQISKREPFGITDITTFLGKKIFNKYVAPFVIKPDGEPTLAPLDDARPEIDSTDSAVKDFS
jgi:hypothetical protein